MFCCVGIWNCCSDFLHSSNTGKKLEYNGTVHQIFIDFMKAYDSVRREVLYNILIVWNPHEISEAH
jgi:hypothetical protein